MLIGGVLMEQKGKMPLVFFKTDSIVSKLCYLVNEGPIAAKAEASTDGPSSFGPFGKGQDHFS